MTHRASSLDTAIRLLFHFKADWRAVPERVYSASMRGQFLFGLCVFLSAAGCVTKSAYQAEARSRLNALAAGRTDIQHMQSVVALPASVREQLGAIADAGQRFSSTCTGSYPHERFLAATQLGRTYNVAIEQGGFLYTWFIMQYVVDENGKVTHIGKIEPSGPADGSQPFRTQ
jgi:hypothetical protein